MHKNGGAISEPRQTNLGTKKKKIKRKIINGIKGDDNQDNNRTDGIQKDK